MAAFISCGGDGAELGRSGKFCKSSEAGEEEEKEEDVRCRGPLLAHTEPIKAFSSSPTRLAPLRGNYNACRRATTPANTT